MHKLPIKHYIDLVFANREVITQLTLDNTSLALGLAKLGLHVFPFTTFVDSTGKTRKRPLVKNGHLDSTTDPETIATWFGSDFVAPSTGVAVHCGPSGIVALDVDVKDGKNGFETVDNEWLDVPDTYGQETPTGGKHFIYSAPEDSTGLGPAAPYRSLEGLDRRAGSSWIGWYSGIPSSREEFATSPEWLLDRSAEREASGFGEGYAAWRQAIPSGEPTDLVRQIITDLPTDNFGHQEVVEITYRLVRLAAEGHTGVGWALDKMHEKWVRPPYDQPENIRELRDAITGAVRKAGAEDEQIAALPEYSVVLDSLPSQFDLSIITGQKCSKSEWFSAIRSLVAQGFDDDILAALVWSAPRLKAWSREWGLDYLLQQIAVARSDAAAVGVNPVSDKPERPRSRITLLTAEERAQADAEYTFIDRYMEWVDSRLDKYNEPYHLFSAWTVLSLSFGMFGFLPYRSRNHGVNFYGAALGGTSTGKSDALGMRAKVEKEVFKDDPSYDIGSDVTIQALQAVLVERDGLPSFFNADEAAGVFKQINEAKHLDGLIDRLTDYYEGYVKPVLRTGNKELSGKSAMTSLHIAMIGTPERVTEVLSKDLFLSGFLVRFGWWIGSEIEESDDQYQESQADGIQSENDSDPAAQALALDLKVARGLIGEGKRHPVKGTQAALDRMSLNRKTMKVSVEGEENYPIMEGAVRRLGDIVRKFSALLALSEGLTTFDTRHVLVAIQHAEYLLENLITVSGMITSGSFERECAEIEAWIKSASNGGSASEAQIYHRFRSLIKFDVRELDSRLHFLERSDRLVKIEATGSKGTRWAINMNRGSGD